MSTDSSVKHNKIKQTKKTDKSFKTTLLEGIKIFLKKRKTKSNNMVMNDVQISHEMKSKG